MTTRKVNEREIRRRWNFCNLNATGQLFRLFRRESDQTTSELNRNRSNLNFFRPRDYNLSPLYYSFRRFVTVDDVVFISRSKFTPMSSIRSPMVRSTVGTTLVNRTQTTRVLSGKRSLSSKPNDTLTRRVNVINYRAFPSKTLNKQKPKVLDVETEVN